MRRSALAIAGGVVSVLWQTLSLAIAAALYFLFALPRWNELTGDWSHTLGTVGRIACGLLIAQASLPVLITYLLATAPELRTPRLAQSLRVWSIVLHIVAGVLIVGAAISEIWLTLDQAGTWLFGIYGGAAGLALLAALAFYLAFVAELPPPPPAPLKVKDSKRRGRGKNSETAEAAAVTADAGEEADAEEAGQEADEETTTEADEEPAKAAETSEAEDAEAEAGNADDAESDEAAKTSGEETADTNEDEAEEKATDDAPAGKLRNRRSGKGSGLFGRGA